MKLTIYLHLLSKLRIIGDKLVIPVYAFKAWLEKTSSFITYLCPLPIIMSEKGGVYAVDVPEAKKESGVSIESGVVG
jgi:hypothetical protein